MIYRPRRLFRQSRRPICSHISCRSDFCAASSAGSCAARSHQHEPSSSGLAEEADDYPADLYGPALQDDRLRAGVGGAESDSGTGWGLWRTRRPVDFGIVLGLISRGGPR